MIHAISIISKSRHFDGGRGTTDSPYRIVKKRHLNNVRRYPNANYRLENDIVFTDEFEIDGEYYNNGALWLPVPGNFNGNFNGQGYKIENLKCNPQANQQGALFVYVGGRIENIYLKNINIANSARTFIAPIAGNQGAASVIEGIFVDGSVLCQASTAGILARSSGGQIRRCGVNIALGNDHNCGGIFSGNSSNIFIYDCYSRGTMQSYFHRGGITGTTFGCRVHNSYSAMLQTGAHSWLRRGIISSYDSNKGGRYEQNCYFDTQACGTVVAEDAAIPINTLQSKYPYEPYNINGDIAYTGWDFDNVWAHDITGTINNGYPYLRNVTPIPN
jgi:hypothetical protein